MNSNSTPPQASSSASEAVSAAQKHRLELETKFAELHQQLHTARNDERRERRKAIFRAVMSSDVAELKKLQTLEPITKAELTSLRDEEGFSLLQRVIQTDHADIFKTLTAEANYGCGCTSYYSSSQCMFSEHHGDESRFPIQDVISQAKLNIFQALLAMPMHREHYASFMKCAVRYNRTEYFELAVSAAFTFKPIDSYYSILPDLYSILSQAIQDDSSAAVTYVKLLDRIGIVIYDIAKQTLNPNPGMFSPDYINMSLFELAQTRKQPSTDVCKLLALQQAEVTQLIKTFQPRAQLHYIPPGLEELISNQVPDRRMKQYLSSQKLQAAIFTAIIYPGFYCYPAIKNLINPGTQLNQLLPVLNPLLASDYYTFEELWSKHKLTATISMAESPESKENPVRALLDFHQFCTEEKALVAQKENSAQVKEVLQKLFIALVNVTLRMSHSAEDQQQLKQWSEDPKLVGLLSAHIEELFDHCIKLELKKFPWQESDRTSLTLLFGWLRTDLSYANVPILLKNVDLKRQQKLAQLSPLALLCMQRFKEIPSRRPILVVNLLTKIKGAYADDPVLGPKARAAFKSISEQNSENKAEVGIWTREKNYLHKFWQSVSKGRSSDLEDDLWDTAFNLGETDPLLPEDYHISCDYGAEYDLSGPKTAEQKEVIYINITAADHGLCYQLEGPDKTLKNGVIEWKDLSIEEENRTVKHIREYKNVLLPRMLKIMSAQGNADVKHEPKTIYVKRMDKDTLLYRVNSNRRNVRGVRVKIPAWLTESELAANLQTFKPAILEAALVNADINSSGETLIQYTMRLGHAGCLRTLIRYVEDLENANREDAAELEDLQSQYQVVLDDGKMKKEPGIIYVKRKLIDEDKKDQSKSRYHLTYSLLVPGWIGHNLIENKNTNIEAPQEFTLQELNKLKPSILRAVAANKHADSRLLRVVKPALPYLLTDKYPKKEGKTPIEIAFERNHIACLREMIHANHLDIVSACEIFLMDRLYKQFTPTAAQALTIQLEPSLDLVVKLRSLKNLVVVPRQKIPQGTELYNKILEAVPLLKEERILWKAAEENTAEFKMTAELQRSEGLFRVLYHAASKKSVRFLAAFIQLKEELQQNSEFVKRLKEFLKESGIVQDPKKLNEQMEETFIALRENKLQAWDLQALRNHKGFMEKLTQHILKLGTSDSKLLSMLNDILEAKEPQSNLAQLYSFNCPAVVYPNKENMQANLSNHRYVLSNAVNGQIAHPVSRVSESELEEEFGEEVYGKSPGRNGVFGRVGGSVSSNTAAGRLTRKLA